MHLYLLQHPGPVNFHGFNPDSLRSRLGITSKRNDSHAILSSANPLPPYYLNILAKDLRVRIAMHIPLIISLVYDKAVAENDRRT